MQRKPVNSSNIVSAGYDPATKRAEVEFKSRKEGVPNSVYSCTGITPEEWAPFERTFQTKDSSGAHYHKYLKSKNWIKQ